MGYMLIFVLGLWLGGFIVILNFGGNRVIHIRKRREEINIEKIKISKSFKEKSPGRDKFNSRLAYFEKYGRYYSPIVLDKNDFLVDGYISYLIAKRYGFKKVQIKRRRK